METHVGILGQKWIEVIFANRNKAYGAYVLRKEYDKNLLLSLLLTVTSLLFLYGLSFLKANASTTKETLLAKEKIVLVSMTPFEKVEVPKVEAASAPASAIDRSLLPPKIVVDTEVPSDLPPDKTLNTTGTGPADVVGTETPVSGTAGGTALVESVDNKLYTMLDIAVMPQFGDSDEDLMRYLSVNTKYPPLALDNNISGKVYVQFVVDKDGSVTGVKVLKSMGFGLDEEAMRVIKSMPKWRPGKQDGHPVAVLYQLPIQFRLK